MQDNRVLSGMRPTGRLHLGHYHGVLKNWLDLQNEYDSNFFVADWHAFTTHYSDKIDLETNVMEMVVDWVGSRDKPQITFRPKFFGTNPKRYPGGPWPKLGLLVI